MRKAAIILVLLTVVFTGCRSKFQKALRGTDNVRKLELADYYYKKKDFYRAQTLFEQLEDIYSGTPQGEVIFYKNAQCDYGLEQYSIAAFRFKTYYETYPTGQYAEEALYMNAYCQFLESQEWELDQTDTYKSIETMRIFVSVYPDSKYLPECNMMLDKLRNKLSYKAYRTAKLYYNIGEYKSAIVAFKNVVNDFPELPQKEEVDYLIVKSHYELASNSIHEKQVERYQQTLKMFEEFAESYTESSKYMPDAKLIKDRAELELKKLENHKS